MKVKKFDNLPDLDIKEGDLVFVNKENMIDMTLTTVQNGVKDASGEKFIDSGTLYLGIKQH